MERVTGIGGVFFRARDPVALAAWYAEHVGVPLSEGYVIFPESHDTHWVPFAADTGYWPADKQHMVNFTVRDLDAMLEQLRAAGIPSTSGSRSTSSVASGGLRTRRETASSSGSRPAKGRL